MTVIVGDDVQRYRLLVVKSALKLESIGMKGKVSASAIARSILSKNGFVPKKNKKELYTQFCNYLNNGGMNNVG